MLLGISSSLEHTTPDEWAAKHKSLGLKSVNFPVDYLSGEKTYMAYKEAAEKMKLTAEDLFELNVIDKIIKENEDYFKTAFFGLFIFISIFNSFNARSYRINILANILKNKIFLIIISSVAIIQIILIYFGGKIFRTTGLSGYEFIIMISLSLTVIPIDFIRKIILRSKNIKGGV